MEGTRTLVLNGSDGGEILVNLIDGCTISVTNALSQLEAEVQVGALEATWFALPLRQGEGCWNVIATAINGKWTGIDHPVMQATVSLSRRELIRLRGNARVILLVLPDLLKEVGEGHVDQLHQGHVVGTKK